MPAQRPLFGDMRQTWSSARALMSWNHWRGSRPRGPRDCAPSASQPRLARGVACPLLPPSASALIRPSVR